MIITVSKKMSFCAAHRLPHYNGNCHQLHGHTWECEVFIKSEVDDESGMVIDFKILKEIMNEQIFKQLDHKYINDVIENPTAENLLKWCWKQLSETTLKDKLYKISIWESPDSCATIERK